jgi:hypothetical protein
MGLSERMFLYCERGRSEALFAEPINAASNVAFLLAALVALLLLLRRPKEMRSADHFLLIALVFVVGLGSLATSWPTGRRCSPTSFPSTFSCSSISALR